MEAGQQPENAVRGRQKKSPAVKQTPEERARLQAERAVEQERRKRTEAEATTAGLDVQWDVAFSSAEDGTPIYLDLWRAPSSPAIAMASANAPACNIGVPNTVEAGNRSPVILWLHGGGWRAGSHHPMPAFLRGATAAGLAIASVGYRKATAASRFPACLHDCRAAVRWLRRRGPELGLDAARIGAVGSSSGGHLAALLALAAGHPGLTVPAAPASAQGSAALSTAEEDETVQAVVCIAGAAPGTRGLESMIYLSDSPPFLPSPVEIQMPTVAAVRAGNHSISQSFGSVDSSVCARY